MSKPAYWLVKSEPETYSIRDFERDGRTTWDGVRNYQARNFMMKDMRVGDLVLFYHSNAKPPCVAGLAEVCGDAIPDLTAQNKKSEFFDPKATKENPIWFSIQLKFKRAFKAPVSLEEIKRTKSLEAMVLVQKGRLSVQPVTEKEFAVICRLAGV